MKRSRLVLSNGVLRSAMVVTLATLTGGCLVYPHNPDERDETNQGQLFGESGGVVGATGGGVDTSPTGMGGSGSGGDTTAYACATVAENATNNSGFINQPVIGCGTILKGKFDTDGDFDQYILNVENDPDNPMTAVTIETFDKEGGCNNLVTRLSLTEPPPGDEEFLDMVHRGIRDCSAVSVALFPGFYYVLVKQGTEANPKSPDPDYMLQVRCHDIRIVSQEKLVSNEEKTFEINLQDNQSIRAELIHPEKHCSVFDGALSLEYPVGNDVNKEPIKAVAKDKQCALIDGTDPSNASYHNKGAGKYKLTVSNEGDAGFNYWLIVTVREDSWCAGGQTHD